MPAPAPTDSRPPQPHGLSDAQAAERLRADGPNELPQVPRRTLWRLIGEVAREPMFRLLAAAVVVYLLIGDLREALMLMAFVVLIVSITLVQERRTERVLEVLRDLTSPRALVLREGVRRRIPGHEVVRGDLIVLSEGDRVPADARLLSAHGLSVDESFLTGESVPAGKQAVNDDRPEITGSAHVEVRPGADHPEFVFAGTLVAGGQGLARVIATGAHSEIGRIGRALGSLDPGQTPLHAQTRQLVRLFSVIGLSLSAVVTVLYIVLRDDWLGGVLAGITLAMSMLPQEFLLILTVFMAMGAWRLSRQRVLTRRPAAIEALGAATVLCTDKTGTLTRNHMTVVGLQLPGCGPATGWTPAQGPLPEAFHALLETGVLASEQEPFDPMEKALHELACAQGLAPRQEAGWELVHIYPLAPGRPALTHVWRRPGHAPDLVAVKGAPETVGALCRLPPAALHALREAAAALAAQGLRVLAVAQAEHPGGPWPASPEGFGLRWQGLVALADPLREGVVEAVRACHAAGIRVVMITGDHPVTAVAIARQAGLCGAGETALTGTEIAAMDEAQLRERVAQVRVCARVMPEQKLRIVQALRASGEVAAMTGDGVNDAPSLKAAHIGIAMGGRGTDVAREASALVLLDDDFGSIEQAVRLGRRIYDNLRKAMAFVLAVHVPIAGLTLLPLLLGLPVLFMPVHIAFLELVINPVCSIVFEAEREEDRLMQRPPRPTDAPLFSQGLIAWSLLQGACVLALVGAFYGGLLQAGLPDSEARAAAFVALVLADFSLILANRSFVAPVWRTLHRPNRALWATLAATLALLGAVLAVPVLREMFRFALPPPQALAGAALLGLAVLVILEAAKPLAARITADS